MEPNVKFKHVLHSVKEATEVMFCLFYTALLISTLLQLWLPCDSVSKRVLEQNMKMNLI